MLNFIHIQLRDSMLVSEVKEEMPKRGITIAQLASWSRYSAGFVGQVLNRTKEATNLPARVRHALEEIRILSQTVLPPTGRQLAYLKQLGFTGEVTNRSEASAWIQSLKDQQDAIRNSER